MLLALHKLYPEAVLFTSVYDSQTAAWAKIFPKINTTFLQQIPFAQTSHELFPWLTQLAFESFDFSSYDIVISLTSAEAKSIITKPETLHICYCLTPTRYLWQDYFTYLKNPGLGLLDPFARLLLSIKGKSLRLSDQVAASRPDYYLAISQTVKKRIAKYYKRECEVIYPGADTDYFSPPANSSPSKEPFFLVVSRLVPYKGIDYVIETFNRLNFKLKIIGIGREAERLKRLAGANIEFLGELTDKTVISYYQKCQALIVSGEEDFCLTAVEVQSCGKPVIAFNKGGATETVSESTGIFFNTQSSLSLTEALKQFDKKHFAPEDCRNQALQFSLSRFKIDFPEKIETLWKNWKKKIDTQSF